MAKAAHNEARKYKKPTTEKNKKREKLSIETTGKKKQLTKSEIRR